MKPCLVFLHGFPFNRSAWQSQIDAFQDDAKIIAPDLRGHGSGPQATGPWMIQHFVQDLKKQLDDQKISKINLCGLSMGGYVALHFARVYPEYIQSLILCDTRPDGDSNDANDKRFISLKTLREKGIEAFASDFSKNVLSATTLKERPRLRVQVERMITGNDSQSLQWALVAIASRQDSQDDLAKFHFPCLVIVGEEDKVTPVEVNQQMAQDIPKAQFVKIPNAGHLSNFEQPEIFNLTLRNFLKGHDII